MKIKWKVQKAESGIFYRRAWPLAEYPDGSPAAMLVCESDYSADFGRGKVSNFPIAVWIARHKQGGFDWGILKTGDIFTLQEAKSAARDFIKRNPGLWPKPATGQVP